MDFLEAVACAEPHAHLLKAMQRQTIAVGQGYVICHQIIGNLTRAIGVFGIPLEILAVLAAHAPVGATIHVVGMMIDRRQSAREDRFLQLCGAADR